MHLHRSVIRFALVAMLLSACTATADMRFARVVMPGPVIEGHAKYENECTLCHDLMAKGEQRRVCRDCHDEIDTDISAREGFHGRITGIEDMECRRCHTEHIGRDGDIVMLDETTFDHARTDFKLAGAHREIPCSACHVAHKPRRDAPHDCYGCHREDDAHREKLGKKCADCHDERSWVGARERFDHDKTEFALHGKHRDVACASCHPSQRYRDIPDDCHDCHKLNDAHGGRYGTDCKECHAESDWKKPEFDHDRDTKYALKGKHRDVECDTCHTGRPYDDKLPTECYGCHKADDQHGGRNGDACGDCHANTGWHKVDFDHARDTKFALTGRHARVDCNACHKADEAQRKSPRACIDCHESDDRHEAKFGRKCASCHRVESWQVLNFDHGKDTEYPLIGRHAEVSCVACHVGEVYEEKLGRDCIDCHREDDPHAGDLGTDCTQCHGLDGWHRVRFDHDQTKFPLIGMHAATPCTGCHVSFEYKDTDNACVDCHRGDDPHTGRLGPRCAACHNPNGWRLWTFDHDTQTEYRLEGAHRDLSCVACHTSVVTDRVEQASDCYSCHVDDDVHHEVFGRECQQCHDTVTFEHADVRR